MARILLGVSGSIAAYKALELVRLLTAAGHGVRVLLTDGGARFVGADSFAALTGAPVLSGVFDDDPWSGAYPGDERAGAHRPIGHLALAERADLLVIAPASANVLARLAGGFADDLLTTAALVAPKLLVAPAMNNRMWEHPATKANVALLRERGVLFEEPGTGRLASKGEAGAGRLAEPADLAARIETEVAEQAASRQDLAGRRVLVSAGGTREPLDAVRFLGNRSSGRMGFALAEAAVARGAYVTVVAANVALPTPAGVTRIDVETAEQLQAACTEAFTYADVLIAAAAVADFRPATRAAGKMKKQPGEETRTLELEKTPDVLAGLAAIRKPGQIVVGFAAEHGAGALDYGRDKLRRKGLDAIVVNDVSGEGIGFDSTENEVVIVTALSETPVPRGTKRAIADDILDVVGLLERTARTGSFVPQETPEQEAAFRTLSAARRAAALAIARKVAASYTGSLTVEELPDEAPLAPCCALHAADGSELAMVSSNAVSTTILVGPDHTVVQLPDDLSEPERASHLEAALRGALDQQLPAG